MGESGAIRNTYDVECDDSTKYAMANLHYSQLFMCLFVCNMITTKVIIMHLNVFLMHTTKYMEEINKK